jgi:hypothetical protein
MVVVMVELDAAIFHQYAEYLWRRAGRIVARWAVVGGLFGGALGAVMLSPWADWPLQHRDAYLLMALGAISGAVLGRSIGSARALGLRLQAQLAQHQLHFERSTLAQHQDRPEPAASPPYVPTGVPPVSAPGPAVAPAVSAAVDLVSAAPSPAPAAAPRQPAEGYGWRAIEPTVL